MPELSKFETLRTQLNENKVKEVMSFGQICQSSIFYFFQASLCQNYLKPCPNLFNYPINIFFMRPLKELRETLNSHPFPMKFANKMHTHKQK